MIENAFHFLTKEDEEYLIESFMDRIGNNKEGISMNEFRDILVSYSKFNYNQNFTNDLLEKCKKKIRERQPGISENELTIGIYAYFIVLLKIFVSFFLFNDFFCEILTKKII